MLRRTPSLALRASVIFMSIYAAIFLAVITFSAAASWSDRGPGNLRGPVLALDYAAVELQKAGGGLQLPDNGNFAKLAAKNPSMWLVVIKDRRSYTLGATPKAALRTLAQFQRPIETVVFGLPGMDMPLGAVAVQQRDLAFGSVILAAGGVDPATLSTAESMHLLLQPEIVGTLVVIAVISLLGMLIAIPAFSRALVPVTAEASSISSQDPGRRLEEAKAPAELLPLVRGFNAALERLDVELARRKRFIADVAHELRTPLAVISLRADSPVDEDARQELRRGISRLTHLVGQMLDLERLSLTSQQSSSVDLVEAASDVVAELAPMAIKSGYDLSLEAPDTPVIVTGDAHSIARAITNLVANSIAHGGGAGQIRVAIGADQLIDVTDEGPGVPATLQTRLFEPLSRGSQNGEGCGLGLHLTREIMRAQGGEVWLVPSLRGATFRLRFSSS